MYLPKHVWNLLIFDSYMSKVGHPRLKWPSSSEDVLFGSYLELTRKWDNWTNCVAFKANVKGGTNSTWLVHEICWEKSVGNCLEWFRYVQLYSTSLFFLFLFPKNFRTIALLCMAIKCKILCAIGAFSQKSKISHVGKILIYRSITNSCKRFGKWI